MLDWITIACAAFAVVAFGLYRSSKPEMSSVAPSEASRPSGPISTIFWTALAVRLVTGAAIAIMDISDFFAPDRRAYEEMGRAIAQMWTVGSYGAPLLEVPRLYHYYNGFFFYATGDLAPWFIRGLNAIAGALSVFFVYSIAETLFGKRAGRLAAWLVALCPSMILWSALNIRDAWAGLAILMIVWASFRLRDRISLENALAMTAGLALLGGIRGYMFLLIGGAVAISHLSAIRGGAIRNYLAGAVVILVFLYLYTSLGFGKQLLEVASFETLNAERRGLTLDAQSAFYASVDISTPGKAFAFLPIGVTYFLFAPFPWMLSNFRQAITLPEMLAWWYLAGRFLFAGIRDGLRVRANHTVTLLSVVLVAVVAYGLVEGNVGTAYRHRAQILPLLLICAAGGWVAKRQRHVAPGAPATLARLSQ